MKRPCWASLIGWVAVIVATVLAVAYPAIAQSPERTYRFELPAQTLGSALRAFGEVARQQIIFSEATVKGKRSHTLMGEFTATEALDRLLLGTGLTVTRTADGVFYVGSGVAAPLSKGPAPQLASRADCRFPHLVRITPTNGGAMTAAQNKSRGFFYEPNEAGLDCRIVVDVGNAGCGCRAGEL
jgi:hypothetical protein